MQVVQSHTVPDPATLNLWGQRIAHLGKRGLQGLQTRVLLGRGAMKL